MPSNLPIGASETIEGSQVQPHHEPLPPERLDEYRALYKERYGIENIPQLPWGATPEDPDVNIWEDEFGTFWKRPAHGGRLYLGGTKPLNIHNRKEVEKRAPSPSHIRALARTLANEQLPALTSFLNTGIPEGSEARKQWFEAFKIVANIASSGKVEVVLPRGEFMQVVLDIAAEYVPRDKWPEFAKKLTLAVSDV